MKSIRRTFVFFIFILLVSLPVFVVYAANSSLLSGERIKFYSPPRWTYSGIWAPGGENILLVDVLADKVRIYDFEGRFQKNVPNQGEDGLGFSLPTAIDKASSATFWIEDEDGRFLLVDSNYNVIKSFDVLNKRTARDEDIRAIYQWVALDGSILAFGDIQKGNSAFSAFLKIPLEHPENTQVLQEMSLEDPGRRLYMVGSPYVAAVNGQPYYLVMSETPYVVTPQGQRLQAVRITKSGRELLSRPKLPEQKGIAGSKLLFQALEDSAFPAGIYGWHNALYVLMRSPSSLGVSVWSMLKIDPKTNQVEWRREIDSKANHLLVIPGDKYWAFIEKGKVNGPGQQSIDSFLRVPSKDF